MRVATSNTEPLRGLPLLPFAEAALTAVTVVAVATMWRLFSDGSYFLPLAAHAVVAHLLAAALRRRGVSAGASAVVCGLAAVIAVSWAHLLSSTWYGVPLLGTFDAGADQLADAWRTFGHVRAPAPVLPGFIISTGLAVWIGAWLADLAAFRQWTPFEALIPGGTLFLFTSLFSADKARGLAAALWLGTALAFVLLHRTARQQTSPSWLGSDARIGTHALLRAGAGVAAAAVFAGWIVGPRLPGASADALLPVTPEDGDGARTTVSPLVDIRGRLVEQSQVELFTITSPRRDYWRMTSLDIFDGDIWSSSGSYGEADGRLAGAGNRGVPTVSVTQTVDVLDLSTIWLPAAFEPTELRIEDGEVRWDDVSSTLIVSTALDTSDGLRYEVVSDIPDFDPAALGAGGEVPDAIADRNSHVAELPRPVAELAEGIVAGAATPYDQALALQDYFRDGSFTYSLAAPSGHSASAIEDFLLRTRTGYCEQFAGAYAAMARSVGLPARVAVGFTPGQLDPSEPGRYVVRGENAHAWPEVYLAGAGWVRFEPTPGRGAPGSEDYTGYPEQQDAAGPSTEPTLVPADDPADPGDAQVPPDGGPSTTVPPLGDVGAEPDPIDIGGIDESPADRWRQLRWVGLGLVTVVVGCACVGGAVALGRHLRRRRRQARATTPEQLVAAHADEGAEIASLLGLVRRRHETEAEFARRVAGELHDPSLRRLGTLMTRAEFDPAGVSDEEAAEAGEVVARIRAAVRDRTRPWQRAAAAMDPRSYERQATTRARLRAGGQRPVGPRIQITASGIDR